MSLLFISTSVNVLFQAVDFAIGLFDDITTFNFQDPSLSGAQAINFFAFVQVFSNSIWALFFIALSGVIVVLSAYDYILNASDGTGKIPSVEIYQIIKTDYCLFEFEFLNATGKKK